MVGVDIYVFMSLCLIPDNYVVVLVDGGVSVWLVGAGGRGVVGG